jgi:serine/threonine-protein kinase HipA
MSTVARVVLWGRHIATIYWDARLGAATFAWERAFALAAPVNPAPLTMPLIPGRVDPEAVYAFPDLSFETYKGLPGFAADSLPDDFGNTVLNRWLLEQGRDPSAVTPVERLCYVGARGLGALSFQPDELGPPLTDHPLELSELVGVANEVLQKRGRLKVSFDDPTALQSIIQVGTSAGGARAKALIAWNQKTGEVRSGQMDVPEGFDHWLVKFDGVNAVADGSPPEPRGFGRIEYAYHLMVRASGIQMSDCRLHEENGRAHFMTRRFDRPTRTKKLHMLSWCGLRHHDFRRPGAHSYEELLQTCLDLELETTTLREVYRRMVFNLVTRNQDDHTKNFAFLMDQSGTWSLAPAYDVSFSFNPEGEWTAKHNITVNGLRDGFTQEDLLKVAQRFRIRNARSVLSEVRQGVEGWCRFANAAGVEGKRAEFIGEHFRRELLKSGASA